MNLIYVLLIVGVATILLVNGNFIIGSSMIRVHSNEFINGLAKYQILALIVSISVTIAICYLNPASKQFLSTGQLGVIAVKEKWLGINGISSWKINALQLLFFVSIATGIFMFLALKYTDSLANFHLHFIPLILLFSFTNSLAEELIFRFGVVGGLLHQYPKLAIMIVSAVLFGLPHFFGWPSGIAGVIMSGVLGYILCKATIETQGLSIAWTIHFVQDVIIFTALFMMNVKE